MLSSFGYVLPGLNPRKMGNLARLGVAPFAPLAFARGDKEANQLAYKPARNERIASSNSRLGTWPLTSGVVTPPLSLCMR